MWRVWQLPVWTVSGNRMATRCSQAHKKSFLFSIICSSEFLFLFATYVCGVYNTIIYLYFFFTSSFMTFNNSFWMCNPFLSRCTICRYFYLCEDCAKRACHPQHPLASRSVSHLDSAFSKRSHCIGSTWKCSNSSFSDHFLWLSRYTFEKLIEMSNSD